MIDEKDNVSSIREGRISESVSPVEIAGGIWALPLNVVAASFNAAVTSNAGKRKMTIEDLEHSFNSNVHTPAICWQ